MSSFGISSSILTNKNQILVACTKSTCNADQSCATVSRGITNTNTNTNNKRTITCFTPRNATGTVSLVNTASATSVRKITTDQNLASVPANAIIDRIEFFGANGFNTKGTFSIGLGQLNGSILTSLIENSTSTIANEKVGGCREFISTAADGKNMKTLVLLQSNVNIVLEHPITSGNLQVVIDYHMKPTTPLM